MGSCASFPGINPPSLYPNTWRALKPDTLTRTLIQPNPLTWRLGILEPPTPKPVAAAGGLRCGVVLLELEDLRLWRCTHRHTSAKAWSWPFLAHYPMHLNLVITPQLRLCANSTSMTSVCATKRSISSSSDDWPRLGMCMRAILNRTACLEGGCAHHVATLLPANGKECPAHIIPHL